MEIRWYYKVIRRSIILIVLAALIPGVVALTLSLLLPPSYEAQAEVAIFKNKADLTFDARFQTISEDELIRLSGQDPRRQTLSALATSDQVLSETLAALPEEWRGEWSLSALKESVKVDSIGNLLQLSVQAGDPQKAASLANTWAETFSRLTNQAFGQPPEEVTSIKAQMDTAWLDYQFAEQALVDFLETSQTEELEYQILIKEEMLLGLQEAFQSAAQTELATTRNAIGQLSLLIKQAGTLRILVEDEPDPQPLESSTQAAILLLQTNALNISQILPEEIQANPRTEIQISISASSDNLLTSGEATRLLDKIVAALDDLQSQLNDTFLAQSLEQITNPGPEAFSEHIQVVHTELDGLNAALERENARLEELTTARDLAWKNYNVLAEKTSEVTIAGRTAETEVIVVAWAIPPEEKAGPKVMLNTAIGVSLGLLAGLVFIFIRAQLDESLEGTEQNRV